MSAYQAEIWGESQKYLDDIPKENWDERIKNLYEKISKKSEKYIKFVILEDIFGAALPKKWPQAVFNRIFNSNSTKIKAVLAWDHFLGRGTRTLMTALGRLFGPRTSGLKRWPR